jgi:hypothetical protein
MRTQWKGADPDATDLLIHMPHVTYRVTDRKGRVRPSDEKPTQIPCA